MLAREAPTSLYPTLDHHIRPIDPRKDLDEVADLIQICFADTMDEDGFSYLRQMRKSAEEARRLEWLTAYADMMTFPVGGFVWEEDNKILGNLTLIPLMKQDQRVFLIANVAVLPAVRRKGIGELLTRTALAYLKESHIRSAWLQVRRDNPAACNLYQKLGFQTRSTRTSWHAKTGQRFQDPHKGLLISAPTGNDWLDMKALFSKIYPSEVIWNLPVDLNLFKPGIFTAINRIINGTRTVSWVLKLNGKVVGCLGWEAARIWTDNLWVGCDQALEADVLNTALAVALSMQQRSHPQSVNYPADKAVDVFKSLGFIDHTTLHWMEAALDSVYIPI